MQFDWDKGNLEHCTKHGVSKEEIESLFDSDPIIIDDVSHSGKETRLIAFGMLNGRRMFVGCTHRMINGNIAIRPITARYDHEKSFERRAKKAAEIQKR